MHSTGDKRIQSPTLTSLSYPLQGNIGIATGASQTTQGSGNYTGGNGGVGPGLSYQNGFSSGNPLTIYGTGGINDPLLSFGTNASNESVLTIKGSGTFSGDISAASGTFAGNVITSGSISASNGLFSVNNGLLTAQSGTIGGWTITGSLLHRFCIVTGKQIGRAHV